MANTEHAGDRAAKWMRWLARGIGSLIGGLFLLILIASAIFDPTPWSLEGAMLAGLVIFAVLGILISWWREGIGGTVVLIGAVALGTFAYVTAGRNKVWAMLITGGPLLVTSLLFLASWRRSRKRGALP